MADLGLLAVGDLGLEGGAGRELRSAGRFDLDGLAGFRVATHARFSLAGLEGAETDQRDRILCSDRLNDAFGDGINRGGGSNLGGAGLGSNGIDQFILVHVVKLLVLKNTESVGHPEPRVGEAHSGPLFVSCL